MATARDAGHAWNEGYALGTVGYALTSLNRQMPLDSFWMGAIGSSALIGIFLGSLLFGWLSDRLGRQRIFLSSFVIISVAAFLQFFATPLLVADLKFEFLFIQFI